MGEVEEVAEMIREGEKPLPEIESRFEKVMLTYRICLTRVCP